MKWLPGLGQEMFNMSLDHLAILGTWKQSNITKVVSKRLNSHYKGALTAKDETIELQNE